MLLTAADAQIARARRHLRMAERDKLIEPYIRLMRDRGHAVTAIAAALNALGLPTERGGSWHAERVCQVMRRLGMATRLPARTA